MPAYQYTPAGVRPLLSEFRKENTEDMRIPLMVHGQTIGAIALRRKNSSKEWTKRERELAKEIAVQVGLAVDANRLLEETRKGAARDQLVANVSNQIRETLDMDSIIQTAAVELRKAFGLMEAEVRLEAPSADKTKPKSAGSNGQGELK